MTWWPAAWVAVVEIVAWAIVAWIAVRALTDRRGRRPH
jgi:hypothetical protein